MLAWERDYLRDLAKKQVELANSEEMINKEKLWYAHNDFATRTPVVTLERGTFNREFQHLFNPKCESEDARNHEYYFHSNMVQYEYIHDDTVVPRELVVGIGGWLKPFNIDIKRERSIGETFAYKIDYEIKDLEDDFHKLQKSPLGCDPSGSLKHKEYLEELFGDIMPVRLSFTPCSSLAQNVYATMGLETMMTSMYDYPELFHKMMTMLSDDYVELWKLVEENNAVYPNNFNVGIPQGTYGFSHELPINKTAPYNLGDVWGYMDSQETSEISPDMYYEFFFPYYKKISERFGRFNYGCCESVSAIWDKSVSNYDNLAKVSISPWCDEEFIGDKLRGKKVIYHRKPFPNYLAIDEVFDDEAFSAHIRKTLEAARGCFFELSYRDVYSLQGELYRGKHVYETIQKCIDKWWK